MSPQRRVPVFADQVSIAFALASPEFEVLNHTSRVAMIRNVNRCWIRVTHEFAPVVADGRFKAAVKC
jgi:hypothetical protein